MNFSSAFSPCYLPQVGGAREVIRIHPPKKHCVCPITAWESSCHCFLAKNRTLSCSRRHPLWSHMDWTGTIVSIFLVKRSPVACPCFGFYCHRQKGEHGNILKLEPRIACYVPLVFKGSFLMTREMSGFPSSSCCHLVWD